MAECGARLVLDWPFLRERVAGGYAPPASARGQMARIVRMLEPDPAAGFRLRPSTDPASRRPPSPPFAAKAPDEVRVLCVGDSVTYGITLAESEAWPARLQEHLRAALPGARIEVYNGGVPGYSAQNCKRLLQTRLMALSPDVVLWQESRTFADAVEPPGATSGFGLRLAFLAYRSRLLYFLTVLREVSRRGTEPGTWILDPPVQRADDYLDSVLPALVAWCLRRGVSLFLPVEGMRCNPGPDGRLALTGRADRLRSTVLPFVPTVAGFPGDDASLRPLFLDRIHLTAAGSDLLARVVAADLAGRPEMQSLLAARAAHAKGFAP
jgi:lysophospholipase L1-like esterase